MAQQNIKQKILTWTLSLGLALAGIVLGTSCLPTKSTDSDKTELSGQNELNCIIDDKVLAQIQQVVNNLKENFPPNQYNYIFVGQSPTPIYAAMYGQKNTYAIPISGLGRIGPLFFVNGLGSGQTFYLEKAFAHFDVYLSSLVNNIAENKAPSGIVIIDYASSGLSAGNFLNLLNLYMRSRYEKNKILQNWVSNNRGFPRTSYFVLGWQGIINTITGRRVGLMQTESPYIGEVVVKEVVPGDAVGTRPVTIKTKEYAAKLNIFPSQPWTGIIFDLNNDIYYDLVGLFSDSNFDKFSPYGSWDINRGILEDSVPQVRPEFLELSKKILGKKSRNCCWSSKVRQ